MCVCYCIHFPSKSNGAIKIKVISFGYGMLYNLHSPSVSPDVFVLRLINSLRSLRNTNKVERVEAKVFPFSLFASCTKRFLTSNILLLVELNFDFLIFIGGWNRTYPWINAPNIQSIYSQRQMMISQTHWSLHHIFPRFRFSCEQNSYPLSHSTAQLWKVFQNINFIKKGEEKFFMRLFIRCFSSANFMERSKKDVCWWLWRKFREFNFLPKI